MQQVTVSTLVRYLKDKLDTDINIQKVLVSGEISNFHRHNSGHLYFTLKDDKSAINCVMFKSNTYSLKFEPKTGDKVIISANTSIFESSGQLQLYVLKIQLDGLGDLYAKYEALKLKLQANGIFDENHKIRLSKTYIDRVAVLVGDKSAAMSDVRTTFERRWPLCDVDFYPVLVQGENAASDIILKLKEVDNLCYDAIILCRGGGSFEDLFCFNDEELVMTIYGLKTFIITGVGHEQDFTLVDFVADCRAATPTASVELITPNIVDVLYELDEYSKRIQSLLERKIDNTRMKFDYYFEKLMHYQTHLEKINLKIYNMMSNIENSINLKLENYKLNLKRYTTLLQAYSYENTLKRGYTLVLQNNKVIRKKKDLSKDEFNIRFIDGDIKVKEA